MNEQEQIWIDYLDQEWDPDIGVLGRAREGLFDASHGEKFVSKLQTLKLPEGESINRRLVSLLWFIPLFLSWQQERVGENGGNVDAFQNFSGRVEGIVMEILGMP